MEELENKMIACKVCNKEFKNYKALSAHLGVSHNLQSQEYYDAYMKKEGEELCNVCGKLVSYVSLTSGYNKYCSRDCSFVARTKKFRRENNIEKEYFKSIDENNEVLNNKGKNMEEPTSDSSYTKPDSNLTYLELAKKYLPKKEFKRQLKNFNSMERERSVKIEAYMKVVYNNYKKGVM